MSDSDLKTTEISRDGGKTWIKVNQEPDLTIPEVAAFERGRKAFLSGHPNIENVWSDDEWSRPIGLEQCCYLGWLVERGLMIAKEEKVRRYIEFGEDHL